MTMENETVALAAEGIAVTGVPEQIRILPTGMVHSQKGDFLVDDESWEMIRNHYQGRGLDLVIDYEHQTLTGTQAPAAGWIKSIELSGGAVVAKVEWTPKAEEYLKNKEYRYLSPVVMVRKTDRRVTGLHSVALTNTPAIDAMFAIVNSDRVLPVERGTEMDIKKLAALLGLAEDVGEDDVIEAVKKLLEEVKQAKEQPEVVANSTILELLGLKEDAKTSEVAATIMGLKNGTGSKEEMEALKESLHKRDAKDAVMAALKDGKITAAQQIWAENYALKDLEGFKAFAAAAPKTVPVGMKVLKHEKQAEQKATECSVDAVVLKNMGLTEEDIEKYANKEEN